MEKDIFDLNILYEDNHLIIINKPRGVLSQPDGKGTLDCYNQVKDYLKIKYQKKGEAFLGIVSRLDRNTQGILVFAKTSKAAARLNEAQVNGSFKKYYLAYVLGNPGSGESKVFLEKDEKTLKAYVTPSGKLAQLKYETLYTDTNASIVEIELYTGRFHQIRCQMAYLGYPLVGDYLYGESSDIPYELCCYKVVFPHPTTKEELEFRINPSSTNLAKLN